MARGDEFIGDPETGYGEFRREGYDPVVGHVSDFFDGRFTVSRNRLTDTTARDAQGRFTTPPTTIGAAGLFSMQELEGGRYDVWSTTSRGVSNRQLGNDVLRMVSGPLEVVDSAGKMYQFDIAPIPINNTDHTWIAWRLMDGTTGFNNVRGTYASTQEVQRIWGPAYRLATPEEAANQSLMKRMYQDGIDEVRKYADQHDLTKEDGSYDLSAAVREMIRIADYSQLSFFARQILE